MDSEEYHSAQESSDTEINEEAESGRHGSPMSRNTYTYTAILPPLSPIRVAVLSKWDNIMGPKPVHVWKQWPSRHKEDKTSSSVEYIVDHTLVAEELNNLSSIKGNLLAAWFHVPQESMLFAAATFQVCEDVRSLRSPHCFSVAFEMEHSSGVFTWKQLILDWLLNNVSKIKTFLTKNKFSLVDDIIKSGLETLHEELDSLVKYKLYRRPMDECVQLLADKQLVERALSSHLQTASSSVVIASTQQQANQMLNILSYLMPKDKLACSQSDRFHPGLAVQGLVLEEGVDLTEKDLLSSPFPLTVIDLRSGTVKQGLLLPLHKRARVIHQMQLQKSLTTDTSTVASGCYQQTIKEGAPLVRSFIKDLLKLCPSEWPAFFLLFYRQLHYRALCMLSFVQDRVEKYRSERGVSWQRGLEKSVKKFLNLEQQDFYIIVSIGEYLQPGITQLFTPAPANTQSST